MTFARPWVLWALLALVPLFAMENLLGRRTARLPVIGAAFGKSLKVRRLLSNTLFLCFLGCSALALAGPSWGFRYTVEYRRGLDLVLALDISRSMLTADCPAPSGSGGFVSRLERARRLALELVGRLDGVRVGAAIGKGDGILAIPITWDTQAAAVFLEAVGDFSMTSRGTNLERLLDAACGAFQDDFPGRRQVLLLTDGESLTGSLQAAMERARNQDIAVSFAGLGTEEGGLVPGLPEDAPVTSVRRGEFLKGLAEKAGGFYTDGNRDEAALILSREFRALAGGEGMGTRRREPAPRWRLFALAALAAFALSRFLAFRPRETRPAAKPKGRPRGKGEGRGRAARGKQRGGKKALGVLLVLGALLCTGCRGIRGKMLILEGNFLSSRDLYTGAIASYLRSLEYPEALPYGEYGLGSVYAALEEDEAALARYQSAETALAALDKARHRELLYRLRYNKGIIFFEEGKFDEAAAAFRGALEIDGGRLDAKRNLELSLLSRRRAPQKAQTAESAAQREGPVTETGGEGGETAIFNYLRGKEQEQWRSREWTGESGYSGPDY